GEHAVTPGPGDPCWKLEQIVSDDFPIPMKIHDGLGIRVDCLVVASQLAAVGSLDPMGVRNWISSRKKIAAGNEGVIENRGRGRHGEPLSSRCCFCRKIISPDIRVKSMSKTLGPS